MSARVWPAVGATCLVLVLAACGDAPSTAGSPSSTSGPAPTTASATGITAGPRPRPTVPPTVPVRAPVRPGQAVTVSGVPEPGVEAGCLLLDGYLLLGGDRSLLASGAAVTVTGHGAGDVAATCQQGQPLVVDTAVEQP